MVEAGGIAPPSSSALSPLQRYFLYITSCPLKVKSFLSGASNSSDVAKEEIKTHDIKKTITLDDLTNPSQK